jgi:hypothetical protein
MRGASSTHARDENAYNIFVQQTEENRQLGMLQSWCQDNIKIDNQEICLKDVDCKHKAQVKWHVGAHLSTVTNVRVP